MHRRISRRHAAATIFALAAAGHTAGHSAQARQSADPPWPTRGWGTADPADQGFAADLPDAIDAALAERPTVTGVVVVRNGRVVTEHYQGDYGPDDPINIRSVTKSVISSLVGIALRRRQLESLDQTVGDLIPDRIPDGALCYTRLIRVHTSLGLSPDEIHAIGLEENTRIRFRARVVSTLRRRQPFSPLMGPKL